MGLTQCSFEFLLYTYTLLTLPFLYNYYIKINIFIQTGYKVMHIFIQTVLYWPSQNLHAATTKARTKMLTYHSYNREINGIIDPNIPIIITEFFCFFVDCKLISIWTITSSVYLCSRFESALILVRVLYWINELTENVD